MDVKKAHEELQGEIEQTVAKIKALQTKLDELREMSRGLELWLARRNGHTPHPGWLDLGRAGAVERMLIESTTPLGPAEISRALAKTGRQGDTPHYVGAALAYLKKQKRARQVGAGRWVAVAKINETRLGDQRR